VVFDNVIIDDVVQLLSLLHQTEEAWEEEVVLQGDVLFELVEELMQLLVHGLVGSTSVGR
jgi:hypothetical protein